MTEHGVVKSFADSWPLAVLVGLGELVVVGGAAVDLTDDARRGVLRVRNRLGSAEVRDCSTHLAGSKQLAEDGSLRTCNLNAGYRLRGHRNGLSSAADLMPRTHESE